ncbi:MAG: Tim44-like domain-containing protein [Polaromonas sp.]|nr:Tim44-like domain-containing protein [Polaromonas sp.]
MSIFFPILTTVLSFLKEIRMRRLLSLLAIVFTVGLSTVAMDAEAAKRLGSGKSMGTQRQATQDKAPAAATPAAVATPAAGAAAAAPSRSWMGPVAGLAAGLGLAALASHLGFGDELASMVMMGLLAAAIMVAIGFIVRKRAAAQKSNLTGPGGLQYAQVNPGTARDANDGSEQNVPAYKVLMPVSGGSTIGSGIGPDIGVGSSASRIPADFDTAGFERNAKVKFIRLQAAYDASDLDDIRQFTTPEMFAELKLELAERGTAIQKTDVVSIKANVIDVDEDADRYLVSVRFTGVIRDGTNEPDESFDEVWHLMKSRQGSSGWVLSGIQQMS